MVESFRKTTQNFTMSGKTKGLKVNNQVPYGKNSKKFAPFPFYLLTRLPVLQVVAPVDF